MSNILDSLPSSIRPIDVLYYLIWLIVALIIGQIIYNVIEHFFLSKKSRKCNWKPMKIHDVDANMNGVHYPVSYWSEQGRRPYQEDAFDVYSPSLNIKDECGSRSDSKSQKLYKIANSSTTSLYGVFDGHGGTLASAFCKENLLKYICESLNRISDTSMSVIEADPDFDEERLNSEVVIRFKESFFRLNVAYCDSAKLSSLQIGTTAVVAMMYRVPLSKNPKMYSNRISVANVGDSRAILVQRGGNVIPLSIDHKPNRDDERERITALGGKITYNKYSRIYRVGGVLAVSRAIGDLQLHPYVICEPEIITREVQSNDLFVVLASDGLWDVMSNEDVGMFIQKKYSKYASSNKNTKNSTVKEISSYCKSDVNSKTIGNERSSTAHSHSGLKTLNQQLSAFTYLAKQLCEEAIILGSTDNITVEVIDLSQFNQQQ